MPRGKLFGVIDLKSDLVMYYVALVIVVAAFLLIVRTIHSPFVQVPASRRTSPAPFHPAPARTKLLAFVLKVGRHCRPASRCAQTLVLACDAVGRAIDGSGQASSLRRWWVAWARCRPAHRLGRGRAVGEQDWRVWQPAAALTSVEWFKTLASRSRWSQAWIFVICVLAFLPRHGEIIVWLGTTPRRQLYKH